MKAAMSSSQPEIILVEDEEMDVLQFQRLARRNDLCVTLHVADNADTAMRLLRTIKKNVASTGVVVVTDLNMPGTTGHEMIEDIRCDAELSPTVVFVLTTSDQPNDVRRAYRNHVAGYIVKDADGRAIEQVICMLRHYCQAVALP